jgi:hypothetical protein
MVAAPSNLESTSMSHLTPAGTQLVHEISQRHGVSAEAATHMLLAVHNGHGTMAQFSHPEFGGSGQWMRGGMTMVSDLFNNQLKARVDSICSDISTALANHQLVPVSGSFQSQSQSGGSSQGQASGNLGGSNSLFASDPDTRWWPSELGSPSATGSQNDMRYAYFADAHRLAVRTGPADVWVYDTQAHRIGGFSQQQGGSPSISFSSQYGTVNLSSLPVVSRNGQKPSAPAPEAASTPQAAPVPQAAPAMHSASAQIPSSSPHAAWEAESTASPVNPSGPAILDTIERLGGLLDKGYITPEEFASKKADLLSRL